MGGLMQKVVLFVSVFGIVMLFSLSIAPSVSADPAWWNENWSYRVPITLNIEENVPPENYQYRIVLDKVDNLSSHCLDNFQDLRFLENETAGELDFWFENYISGDNVVVWFEREDNSLLDNQVFCYYSNASAGAVENGDETFIFFEDFSGDLSSWNVTGSPEIDTGRLKIAGISVWNGAGVTSTTAFARPFVMESVVVCGSDSWFALGYGAEALNYQTGDIYPSAGGGDILDYPTSTGYAWTLNSWHLWGIAMKEATIEGHKMYYDGVKISDTVSGDARNNYRISFQSYNATAYWDNIRVRKYVSPEPTLSVGVEEALNVAPDKPENLLPFARQTSTTVALYADVHDNDGDAVNVRFFDNSDNSLIDNVWADSDTTATVNWTPLTRGNTYVFYVNADDGTENGENSDTQTFTVNALPTVPTGINDLSMNLTDHTPDKTFTKGTDGDGDTVYTVAYLGTSSSSTEEDVRGTGATLTLGENASHSTYPLADGTTYYVRLRSWDGYEWSASYTADDQFRMNTPPIAENQEAESTVNPTQLITLTPTLSWDYYDADGDTQENFQIQVGTSENANDLWDNNQQNSDNFITYAGSPLDNDVTYHWRVRVYDNYEWSSWLYGGTFRIVIPPPLPPEVERWEMPDPALLVMMTLALMVLGMSFDSPILAFFGGVSSIFVGLLLLGTLWVGMIFLGFGIYFILIAIMSEEGEIEYG